MRSLRVSAARLTISAVRLIVIPRHLTLPKPWIRAALTLLPHRDAVLGHMYRPPAWQFANHMRAPRNRTRA
jgi:hypothetical protein